MATERRWLTLVIGVLVAWSLAGPARADSKTVLLKGLKFDPKTVAIELGDKVVWKYDSGERHSLNFEDGTDLTPGCGGLLGNCLDQPDETRSRTFSKAGEFAFYCRFHGAPGGQGMSGVVEVAATPATAAAPASTSTTQPVSSTTTTKPSTTTTTRPLTTSSTVLSTTTTLLAVPATPLTPNEPPDFDPGDGAGGQGDTASPSGDAAASTKNDSGDSSTVALIVALLLAVAAGGGFLLWRLRPGRGTPPPP
jgi:plastocyanin